MRIPKNEETWNLRSQNKRNLLTENEIEKENNRNLLTIKWNRTQKNENVEFERIKTLVLVFSVLIDIRHAYNAHTHTYTHTKTVREYVATTQNGREEIYENFNIFLLLLRP